MEGFLTTLAKASPKLKTPIQLTGFIVAGILFYLASASKPPNLLVQITSGLIAVSVLVFGVTLNLLSELPQGRRISFILRLFAMFGALIFLFLVVSVYFLLATGDADKRARADVMGARLRAMQKAESKALDDLQLQWNTLRRNLDLAQLGGHGVINELQGKLKLVDDELAGKRKRLAQIDRLLEDLLLPSPTFVEVVQFLDPPVASTSSGGILISSAFANDNLKVIDEAKKALEARIKINDDQNLRARIYLAWLGKISGDRSANEVKDEAISIWQSAPNDPLVTEFLAEAYADLGSFSEAAKYYRMLVDQIGAVGPVDHMRLALAYKELASNTRLAEGGAAGEEFIRQAENVYQSAMQRDEVVLANIKNDLGGFYLARMQLVEAKECYDAALAYFDRRTSSRYGHAYALMNLGKIFTLWHNPAQAVELIKRSQKVQEETTGPGTSVYAVTLQLMGEAQQLGGRYADAARTFEREQYLLKSRRFRPDLLEYVQKRVALSRYYERRSQEETKVLAELLAQHGSIHGAWSQRTISLRVEMAEAHFVLGAALEARALVAVPAGEALELSDKVLEMRLRLIRMASSLWLGQPIAAFEVEEIRRFGDRSNLMWQPYHVYLDGLNALNTARVNRVAGQQEFCGFLKTQQASYPEHHFLRAIASNGVTKFALTTNC